MFKLTKKFVILIQRFNKKKYLIIFGNKLTKDEKEFKEKNGIHLMELSLIMLKNQEK